MNMM